MSRFRGVALTRKTGLTFIGNQCLSSPKRVRGVCGESILKQNVFNEALAMAFPIAILQIEYVTVHIALSTNLLVGYSLFVRVLTFKVAPHSCDVIKEACIFYIILCDIHVYLFQQSFIKIELFITTLNSYIYMTKCALFKKLE